MASYVEGMVGSQRPPSIRSVASNSSVASGASLTRRARTRARSRTVTGEAPKDPIPDLPCLNGLGAPEPSSSVPSVLDGPPARPQRSPNRGTTDSMRQGGGAGQPSQGAVPDESRLGPTAGKSSQTSGLPVLPTALQPEPPPSAFSRDPSLVNVSGSNVRDSLSTQLSGMSSSIYPPSTPSVPDSLLLSTPSMRVQDDSFQVGQLQEFDDDDVSYRLQLLMKNSYFLPPAHSKPSPADLASQTTNSVNQSKKPTRNITPTFLDLLWGKSKRRPSSPAASDVPPLVLRTAADSVTPFHALQPRLSSQVPRVPPLPGVRTGRVVVVREKMNDLSAAAKQAEADMRIRSARRDQPAASSQSLTDVIDPTDAVDVPIPSSAYPFAVQASALHGLGVHQSLGAALLADRLPPPQSPGMSFSSDEDWRKTLLHQAVHHSLDGLSQDMSPFHICSSSTPLMSPRPSSIVPESPTVLSVTQIGKPILDQHIMETTGFLDQSPSLHNQPSSLSLASTVSSKLQPNDPLTPRPFRQSIPTRAQTPSDPLTPLTPAPRKFLINPLHSLSQAELPKHDPQGPETPGRTSSLPYSLRKAMSTPVLSDTFEDGRYDVLTPLPASRRQSFRDVAGSPSIEALTESHYSDDEEQHARASLALSAINGRPSVSEYSQPSPSPSVYDMLNISNTSSNYISCRQSTDQISSSPRDIQSFRYSAIPPPARTTSSFTQPTLIPPLRSSSLRHPDLKPQASGNTHITEPLTDDTTMVIIAPEPTSPVIIPPPLPLAERRGIPPLRQLSLDVPPVNIPAPLRSAPGPSSPTSFFDSLQSQHAMDDLESSDSEDESEKLFHRSDGPVHPYADPRNQDTPAPSRPSLTRLGNHSTPHVSRVSGSSSGSHPFVGRDRNRPVGNVPARKPFFTERGGRSDSGHGPPISTLDFYQFTQRQRPGTADQTGKRRSTVGSLWPTSSKTKESMKRLDGMLIQHMEAEKDRMRQIARTASNIPVDSNS